jgi:hypothetical protein
MSDNNNNIKALCKFLGIPETEAKVSEYNDSLIEVISGEHEGEEYVVGTAEEVEKAAIEDEVNLLDDIGLEALTEGFRDRCLAEVDCPWEEWASEDNRGYCRDICEESDRTGVFSNRLEQEAVEAGVKDEKKDFEKGEDGLLHYKGDYDELIDDMVSKMDERNTSMSEYFENIYGKNWVSELKDTLEQYVDYEKIARKVIEEDGVANTLARYDGIENEVEVDGKRYYIYRSN